MKSNSSASPLVGGLRRIRDTAQWAAPRLRQGDSGRREVWRDSLLKLAKRLTPVLEVRSPNGVRMLVNTRDVPIGYESFVFGSFDADFIKTVVSATKDHLGSDFPATGRVFIDVGANIGTTTVPAIMEWGASLVLAIEPEPENFKLLRCNTILNCIDNQVVCVQAAATDKRGPITLELSGSNSGDHRVKPSAAEAEHNRGTVTVEGAPLDELIDANGIDRSNIGLVWIDVQGHEGQVLDSAPITLAARVPMVLEYWPYALSQSQGLELLHGHIAASFSAFVDLNEPRTLLNAEHVEQLRLRYEGLQYGHDYTNLLLIP